MLLGTAIQEHPSTMSDNSSTHSTTSENLSENGSTPIEYSSDPADNNFSTFNEPSSALSSLLSDSGDDSLISHEGCHHHPDAPQPSSHSASNCCTWLQLFGLFGSKGPACH